MNIDEQNIIQGLKKGKEKSLKTLYDRFFPALCSYAYKYVKDEMIAGDIVQEVYIKIWYKRKNFDSIYSIRSYFYLSVRNSCLNYIRDNSRHVKVDLDEEIISKEENFVVEEEVHRMIRQEIDNLPDAMRRVFNLTLMDMSVAEIAEALHVSVSTVKNQRMRAREILREKLKDWVFLFFI